MELMARARALCPEANIQRDILLDRYTTLRVGGPADYFAEPENEEMILALLQAAKETDTPVLLLGNGSNLLVKDGGVRGLVIRLGKKFSGIQVREDGLYAQAGALMSALSKAALEAGFTGLEFSQGIPGTVGGGAYMNAGAYGGEMSQVISSLRVLKDGRIQEISASQMEFGYRHTRAMAEGWLILGASFHLEKGDPQIIEARMADFAARRKEKQPLEYPSAGSFFKRPAGYFAGALIEQSQLKGVSVGGAQVSEKHAGFLINRGDATAKDFLDLMALVQETVMKNFGVKLENEVRILGSEL
ncbi:MAG: UDP-N-acetylmuramate dehydrogenase [Clostridiales bacterium]|nr:UDP-N-acetylmuramate dehydrogenase [Clostridiales bacterium]